MSVLIRKLLERYKIAVVSGCKYEQFVNQFVSKIDSNGQTLLQNLFLFPTCATAFYRHSEDGWIKVYSDALTDREKKLVRLAINFAVERTVDILDISETWGEQIEDRGSQITFSALGQEAPLEAKQRWDANQHKRRMIKVVLDMLLPDFEVNIGGTTSIDVMKKGMDKSYAIKQIEKFTLIDRSDMLFVGDALCEGGNDYPIRAMGVECVGVKDEEETKKMIKNMLLDEEG